MSGLAGMAVMAVAVDWAAERGLTDPPRCREPGAGPQILFPAAALTYTAPGTMPVVQVVRVDTSAPDAAPNPAPLLLTSWWWVSTTKCHFNPRYKEREREREIVY